MCHIPIALGRKVVMPTAMGRMVVSYAHSNGVGGCHMPTVMGWVVVICPK